MSKQCAVKALVAAALLGWLSTTNAQAQNTAPLAFGMTPQDAEIALGVPLQYLSGRRAPRFTPRSAAPAFPALSGR